MFHLTCGLHFYIRSRGILRSAHCTLYNSKITASMHSYPSNILKRRLEKNENLRISFVLSCRTFFPWSTPQTKSIFFMESQIPARCQAIPALFPASNALFTISLSNLSSSLSFPISQARCQPLLLALSARYTVRPFLLPVRMVSLFA
jgi:hypothetical protein